MKRNIKNEIIKKLNDIRTYYLLVLFVVFVTVAALVELGCATTLSTELEGFVSLSGGSLRFSITNNTVVIFTSKFKNYDKEETLTTIMCCSFNFYWFGKW